MRFNLETTGKNENLPVNFIVTFIFHIQQKKFKRKDEFIIIKI
jgi:hypothetical protein